jgi:endonuclease YncB( thermonuclease family)
MSRVVLIAVPVIAALVMALVFVLPGSVDREPEPGALTIQPGPDDAEQEPGIPALRRGAAGGTGESADAPRTGLSSVPHPPRNVTPPGIFTGPVRGDMVDEAPPRPPDHEPDIRTYPRVVVEAAGLLRSDTTMIRVGGVVTPEPEATCPGTGNEQWPCGRAARGALRLLIRNRAVECEITAQADDTLVGDCVVAGRSIAGWLVEQGWAAPTDESRYREAAKAAREAGRGMFAEASSTAPAPVTMPEPFRAPAIDTAPAATPAPGR